MSETREWSFPDEVQPKQVDLDFELERTLNAMVSIRAEIPEDAFTAQILGTDRGGSAVVIRDNVILTIGYLITEAQSVWITTNQGQVVQGYPLAYDQITGFGLVRALGSLNAPPIPLGTAATAKVGDRVLMMSKGGVRHSLMTKLTDKREFAGYWEYLLDEALFTAPAHPEWSGAALVNAQGQLLGVGSLLSQEVSGDENVHSNMSVPVDLLEPILENLLTTGRSGVAARPWLGLYAGESEGQVMVGGLSAAGPAEKAGIRQGDLIVDVAGVRVTSLADFLRAVWGLGVAGVKVPLNIGREGDLLRLEVKSLDRNDLLKRPQMH
jgi:S1-C subfamily serine protease